MAGRVMVALSCALVVVLLAILIAVTLSNWVTDNPELVAYNAPRALPDYHFVEHGETLWDIANHYWPGQHTGKRVHDVVMLNGLHGERYIYPGQRLKLQESAVDTL